MADSDLAFERLRPSGDRILTPPLGDSGARLVLQGVFTFTYNGERFDALFRTGPDGGFTQRHSLLQWSPRPPLLESADVLRHRYEFRVPAGGKLQGQSIGLRLDLDQLVDEFLIPPSDVRAGLTGEMELRVLPLPATPAGLWLAAVGTSVPLALMVGGLGWIVRRRMALAGLPVELQLQIDRIGRKHRAAIAALQAGPLRYHGMAADLKALQTGTWELARRIGALQSARSRLDRTSLVWDVAKLEQELVRPTDAITRAAREAALGEKRKTLALLEQVDRREACCSLRLTALEATLDSAGLTFRQLQTDESFAPAVETLRRELESEVAAIAEEALDGLEIGCVGHSGAAQTIAAIARTPGSGSPVSARGSQESPASRVA